MFLSNNVLLFAQIRVITLATPWCTESVDRRQFGVFLPHKRSIVAIPNATDTSRWKGNSEGIGFQAWADLPAAVGAVYIQ